MDNKELVKQLIRDAEYLVVLKDKTSSDKINYLNSKKIQDSHLNSIISLANDLGLSANKKNINNIMQSFLHGYRAGIGLSLGTKANKENVIG